MKKIFSLIVTLFLLLGSTSLVHANTLGNLSFNANSISYEEEYLVIKAVLANIGNKTLENISSFSIKIVDADGKIIANSELKNDQFLSNLKLPPGESVSWTLKLSGAEKGNLTSYKTEYSAKFNTIGNASHVSGTLIVVNNIILKTDTAPTVENGTTLVPLRAIFESLGAKVNWDSNTQTVTATRNNDIVKLTLGNKYLTINDRKVTFDTPAKIINEATMVPLRVISESFGGNVAYGKTGDAVTISIRVD